MGSRYLNPSGNTFYEAVFNLIYVVKNYHATASKTSMFSKDNKDSNYSNLFIWNIETKQKTKVFSDEDASKERIVSMFFEESYNEEQQLMLFNVDFRLLNNRQIPFRHPKNLLLIETYQEVNGQTSLWTCDKHGQNLQKITSLQSETEWHLDVGNSLIRTIQHQPKDVEFTEFRW